MSLSQDDAEIEKKRLPLAFCYPLSFKVSFKQHPPRLSFPPALPSSSLRTLSATVLLSRSLRVRSGTWIRGMMFGESEHLCAPHIQGGGPSLAPAPACSQRREHLECH